MAELIYKEESYKIVGAYMEVHRELGMGFKEIVYKDALEIELKMLDFNYESEKSYKLNIKAGFC